MPPQSPGQNPFADLPDAPGVKRRVKNPFEDLPDAPKKRMSGRSRMSSQPAAMQGSLEVPYKVTGPDDAGVRMDPAAVRAAQEQALRLAASPMTGGVQVPAQAKKPPAKKFNPFAKDAYKGAAARPAQKFNVSQETSRGNNILKALPPKNLGLKPVDLSTKEGKKLARETTARIQAEMQATAQSETERLHPSRQDAELIKGAAPNTGNLFGQNRPESQPYVILDGKRIPKNKLTERQKIQALNQDIERFAKQFESIDPLGIITAIVAAPANVAAEVDVLRSGEFTPLEKVGAVANVFLQVGAPGAGKVVSKLGPVWKKFGNTAKFDEALNALNLKPEASAAVRDLFEKNPGVDWENVKLPGGVEEVPGGGAPASAVKKIKADKKAQAEAAKTPAKKLEERLDKEIKAGDTDAQAKTLREIHGVEAPVSAPKQVKGTKPPKTKVAPEPKTVKPSEKPETPHDGPNTIGLANQVEFRMAEGGRIDPITPGAGKKWGEATRAGKKAVEDKAIDPYKLADELDASPRPISSTEVGALLEGARRLESEINRNIAKMASKKGKELDEISDLVERGRDELTDYLQKAQRGKTELSDAFRALQEGVEVDTGNIAQVLKRREDRIGRGLSLEETTRLQKEVAELHAQVRKVAPDYDPAKETVAQALRRVKDRVTDADRAKAEAVVRAVSRRPRTPKTIEEIVKQRVEARARIDKRLAQAGAQAGAGPGQFFSEIVKSAPEIVDDIKIIIRGLAEEFQIRALGKTLYDKVRAESGVEITDDEIIKVLSGFYDEAIERNPTKFQELTAAARKLVRGESKEAREAASAVDKEAKATVQRMEKISDLDEQLRTGGFWESVPKVKKLTREQELLDLQIQLREENIRHFIRERDMTKAEKAARFATSTLRSATLGSDVGVLARQGMRAWSKPLIAGKNTIEAFKAMVRDENLLKFQNELRTREIDGRLAEPIRRRHSLSRTTHWGDQEEYSLGKLFRWLGVLGGKMPGKVGEILRNIPGAFDRFQSAFINGVRTDFFDYGIRHGWSEAELADRAKYVNSVFGRANIRGGVGPIAEIILTSPRYEKSRWETLYRVFRDPVKFAASGFKDKSAQEAVKEMSVMVGEVGAVFALANLAGFDVDLHPLSKEFGILKRGRERWDISAGLGPRFRDFMRVIAMFENPGKSRDSVATIAGRAATRAISPGVMSPAEWAYIYAQRQQGVPEDEIKSLRSGFELDPGEKGYATLFPLIWRNTDEALKEQGYLGGISTFLREFVGTSVNRYDEGTDLLGRENDKAFQEKYRPLYKELERIGLEPRRPQQYKASGETDKEFQQRIKEQTDAEAAALDSLIKTPAYQAMTKTERLIEVKKKMDDVLSQFYGTAERSKRAAKETEAKKAAEAAKIEKERKAGIR